MQRAPGTALRASGGRREIAARRAALTPRWIWARTIAACWWRVRRRTAFASSTPSLASCASARAFRRPAGSAKRRSSARSTRCRVCRDKMAARGVTRARLIATEACRAAENGVEFLERVRERLGLKLEIVDRETEATLAAAGCGELADREAQSILLFDIGGGSSEIIWLDRARATAPGRSPAAVVGVAAARRRHAGREIRRRRGHAGSLSRR